VILVKPISQQMISQQMKTGTAPVRRALPWLLQAIREFTFH
jgi:DNA-binding GntR family transcriptional regulator